MQKLTIKTERLLLQPLSMSHLDAVIRYGMDADNAQMMVNLPFASAEEVEKYIAARMQEWEMENPYQLSFAVMLGEENIGMVDAYFEAPGETELGWIIDKRYWGNGYAAEAARGLIAVCREYLEMRRFIAHCDSENRASIRVMEKLGMQLEEQQGGRYNRAGGAERLESRYAVEY